MSKRFIYLATLLLCFGVSLNLQAQDEEASAASLYNQGLEKAKAKEYVAALDLLEKAIAKADPENETDAKVIRLAKRNGTRAAYGAGNFHRKAKDMDSALKAYETGIEYNPEYYSNYVGKAQVLNAKADPASVKFYLLASQKAAAADKAERAEGYASKAQNIIAVSWGKKEWDKTIAYANSYLEEKETADVHYYLASSLKAKGDSEKALEHVAKSIELAGDADASKFYMLKAETHEKLGQKSDAVAAYKMVKDAKYAERAKYKIGELGG